MMGSANYFFIDGSALTAQIRHLRRTDTSFAGRRLCPRLFTNHLMRSLPELHGNSYKRITFYFPIGDEAAVEDYLVMPDHNKPGEIRDLHFKFCGQKLKRTKEFIEFVETQVPKQFKDRFSKSEKGIDILYTGRLLDVSRTAQVPPSISLAWHRPCSTLKCATRGVPEQAS
jgi:hypothetical protein